MCKVLYYLALFYTLSLSSSTLVHWLFLASDLSHFLVPELSCYFQPSLCWDHEWAVIFFFSVNSNLLIKIQFYHCFLWVAISISGLIFFIYIFMLLEYWENATWCNLLLLCLPPLKGTILLVSPELNMVPASGFHSINICWKQIHYRI